MYTATDSFARSTALRAKPRYLPTSEQRTPYIAMLLDKSMIDAIKKNIKTIYGRLETKVIPTCWNSVAPEPPTGEISLRVLGSANNYIGMQILMLEVNGQSLRKDGVPYHVVWSVDEARRERIVKDTAYSWPIKKYDEPLIRKEISLLEHFTCTSSEQKIRRILSDIDVEAEQLAQECYDTAQRGYSVYGNIFDYMACPIDVKFPNIAYQPIRWIDYSNGHRLALDIVW